MSLPMCTRQVSDTAIGTHLEQTLAAIQKTSFGVENRSALCCASAPVARASRMRICDSA